MGAWYKELSVFLIDYGLINSTSDTSLFVYKNENTLLYFLCYIDDLIITGNNNDIDILAKFITQLSHRLIFTKGPRLNKLFP